MIKLGDFFFKYRNWLFPVFYALMFLPGPRIMADWQMAVSIGLVIAFLGQAVRMTTIGFDYIIRGGRNKKVYAEDLVTGGLFAHSRNPMYVGNVAMILGVGILSNNLIYLLVMMPAFFFIYECIIRAEENFLRNKFGEGFEKYTRDVPRWLPKFSGLGDTLNSGSFNWKRVLIKEYNTTCVWLGAAVLLIATHIFRHEGKATFDSNALGVGIAVGLIIAIYFTIRYLKKSGTVQA
jgi:protein-S-isoprenylcysteine O-methyltransferase Ste14